MSQQTRREQTYVGFDSDTLTFDVPAQTAVTIIRPDGGTLCRYPARPAAWHLTYTGQLSPGVYNVELVGP